MRLSDFIRHSVEEIVAHSVRFAESLGPLSDAGIDVTVLRDHLPLVLRAIALDLDRSQTPTEGITKSEGGAPAIPGETAAQTHGRLRAESGLSVGQVVAEYRVLRAVIIRLWSEEERGLPEAGISELVRFNEPSIRRLPNPWPSTPPRWSAGATRCSPSSGMICVGRWPR